MFNSNSKTETSVESTLKIKTKFRKKTKQVLNQLKKSKLNFEKNVKLSSVSRKCCHGNMLTLILCNASPNLT